jgi:thioredoxin reductase (NADPH)
MTELITIVVFGILTTMFVVRHMKQRGGDAKGTTCPRCRAAVAPGAARCPKCNVPMQLYEVVSAAAVTGEDDDKGAKTHAVVRADLCVGCGACVPVCPEPGAIKMTGKLATVNATLCMGHGKCVEACPVGGIVLARGGSVHRVEVPEVDTDFESNVRGVFVVGELGGRGLIKNAINEAKVAIEHIAADLAALGKQADNGVFDVVVVGSGPAGLSAGLEAMSRGLRYVVLEQGALADTIRKYPRAKFLLAEPVTVPLYGNLWVSDASKEQLLKVWEEIIAKTRLDVRTNQRVVNVEREAPILKVETADAVYRARRVVLAMGRRGSPRRLGVQGEEAAKVIYDVVDMESFAGQHMLVVGGGDSAVESAVGLARQKDTTVTLSYRGAEFQRVKERNRSKLDEAVHCGAIRVLLKSQIREIREHDVVLDVDGLETVIANDIVVIRIGGDPPFKFLEQIGIRIVKKDVPLPKEESFVA